MSQTPDEQPTPPTPAPEPEPDAARGPASDDDLAHALASASQRRPGPSRLTLALSAGVLLVGGSLGGYFVGDQSSHEGSAADQRVGFPGGFTPGGPDGGLQPDSQSPGDLTSGTVTKVAGGTVTIQTADGDDVTVKTDDSTDVTITKDGSVSDLSTGDPVVVMGSRGSDGSISADSISEGNNRFALAPGDRPAT